MSEASGIVTEFDRSSGVFCHPTSLPGRHGIGSLGESAHRFVDALADAGQSLWQLCPLGPTTPVYGNSPYQTYSALAIEPLLIDLDDLVERGLLEAETVEPGPGDELPAAYVDYEAVAAFKAPLLREAFETFVDGNFADLEDGLDSFRERADWLADYALFRALRTHFDGDSWIDWPKPIRLREDEAIERYRRELSAEIRYREFVQFVACDQWTTLRDRAAERGVDIVGDIPIYVAHDSADVWANRECFALDEDGSPEVVGGAPPDQKWGNPVYDWDALREDGYQLWVDRLSWLLDLVDVVRLDHFIGFVNYWAIPVDQPPSVGEWLPGPGIEFFETLEAELGELPIIAENIGDLTDEVEALRRELGAPGMNVLEFADWCTEDHEYLPHMYEEASVAYPSTHDTNTVRGWYESMDDHQYDCMHYYLDTDGSEIHWDVIEAAWWSDSVMAVTPLQDLYGLGSDARFNVPGTAEGNWEWRCSEDRLEAFPTERLRELTDASGR